MNLLNKVRVFFVIIQMTLQNMIGMLIFMPQGRQLYYILYHQYVVSDGGSQRFSDVWQKGTYIYVYIYRADSRFVPSQWEIVLLCNDISHWLGTNLKSALLYICIYTMLLLTQLMLQSALCSVSHHAIFIAWYFQCYFISHYFVGLTKFDPHVFTQINSVPTFVSFWKVI